MTNKDIEREVQAMKEYGECLLQNPTEADKFFQDVGIYNKVGELRKEYGGKAE